MVYSWFLYMCFYFLLLASVFKPIDSSVAQILMCSCYGINTLFFLRNITHLGPTGAPGWSKHQEEDTSYLLPLRSKDFFKLIFM